MVQSIKERLEQLYSEFKTDKEREEFEEMMNEVDAGEEEKDAGK